MRKVPMSPQEMVEEFYREKVRGIPHYKDAWDFFDEEVEEVYTAGLGTIHELKELADVVYTAYGYAISRGWNLDRALEIVHASNMTKPPSTDGRKVQKGPLYVAPDLSSAVRSTVSPSIHAPVDGGRA